MEHRDEMPPTLELIAPAATGAVCKDDVIHPCRPFFGDGLTTGSYGRNRSETVILGKICYRPINGVGDSGVSPSLRRDRFRWFGREAPLSDVDIDIRSIGLLLFAFLTGYR
jgi:hypothetical protein